MIIELKKRSIYYISLILNSRSPTFLQIIEHQKSGGTWVARLLSSYYDIPFYSQPGPWMKKKGVVRIHSKSQYTIPNANQIYVIRDGRDVLTSYYFHLFLRLKVPQVRFFSDIMNVKTNMHRFLEMYFNKQLTNKIVWHEHADYWMPKVTATVRYEDLLEDTPRALMRLIQKWNQQNINKKQIQRSISNNEFEKLAGRKPGDENRGSFFRKGISGDWKNYFNKKSAKIFNEQAGETLIRLGYETDSVWVSNCSD